MSVPSHDQIRHQRLARLLTGAYDVTGVAASPLLPFVPSIAAKVLSSNANTSSAFSAANMGDDQSPVCASAYAQGNA